MLPGTRYSPEDIARIVLRRRWVLLAPLLLGIAAGQILALKMPKIYRSETLIMIVPQRVPDSYVRATVTSKIEDRLPTISQQILSRTRLERIIADLDLYPAHRAGGITEAVIQQMRNDIDVKIERGDSFRVTYVSGDPLTAQRVTERIASLFIEENLRDRENLAEDTNQFLESQLQDAKRRLIEHEKKLEAYNKRFSGQLPSQATTNLQQIQAAQLREQALAEALDRDRERRLVLERQLAEQESTDPVLLSAAAALAPARTSDGLPLQSTAEQLEAARAQLRLLETRVKPDHPDIRQAQRTVRDLEVKLAAEPTTGSTSRTEPSPAEAVRQKRVRELKGEIEVVDREIQDKLDRDQRLRTLIAGYQAKVDAVPTRQAELVELTRDYTTLQNSYQSLLAKREESKIAANLERRNIGEQFKILDPARVPESPFTPDRRVLLAGGGVIGFGLGALVIVLLEYLDGSLKREDEVLRVLSVPVLAVVPLIDTDADLRDAARRRWWGAILAAAITVACAIAMFWRIHR